MTDKQIVIVAVSIVGVYLIYNYINNRKSDDKLNNTNAPNNLQDVLNGQPTDQNQNVDIPTGSGMGVNVQR